MVGGTALECLERWLRDGRFDWLYPYEGLAGGYPTLTIYKHWRKRETADNDGDTYHNPDDFYQYCLAVMRQGGRGIHIWPGPFGVWTRANGEPYPGYENYSQAWEDRKWELIAAATSAIKSYRPRPKPRPPSGWWRWLFCWWWPWGRGNR